MFWLNHNILTFIVFRWHDLKTVKRAMKTTSPVAGHQMLTLYNYETIHAQLFWGLLKSCNWDDHENLGIRKSLSNKYPSLATTKIAVLNRLMLFFYAYKYKSFLDWILTPVENCILYNGPLRNIYATKLYKILRNRNCIKK